MKLPNIKIKSWLWAAIWAFLLTFVVRTFIFEPFYLNSDTLKPEYNKNDLVLVNKLKIGGRFPITPLAFPLVKSYIPFTSIKSYVDFRFPYVRFFGFGTAETGDYLVFNNPRETKLPIDRRSILMRKCVAKSGDSIFIYDKEIIVNQIDTQNYKVKQYRMWLSPKNLSDAKKYNLEITNLANYSGSFLITSNNPFFTEIQKDTLIKLLPLKTNITPAMENANINKTKGKYILVPKKNQKIELDAKKISYLKPVLLAHEEVSLKIKNNKLFINEKQTNFYTFKQNYYLVLNQPLTETLEFELVPESHLVGTASW